MRKTKRIISKILIILSLMILNFMVFINSTTAVQLNSANIYAVKDCGSLLKYKGVVVKVTYVEYSNNGMNFPAYCLDKTKPGAEVNPYEVSVSEAIQDVKLWRYIINGYPYKTLNELGVASQEEAFTATKQAIYCYNHGNDINSYEPIGEAGVRTLNAMHQIINNANNSTESQISNVIRINKNIDKWKQDEREKEYISKRYSVSAETELDTYKITLNGKDGKGLDGIKLVDENNNIKNEFKGNEDFKIMVPIKQTKEKGAFNIEVAAQVKTKAVLYGKAPNSSYQDYALTAATYEDGKGNAEDEYIKNETKIIIIKQDVDTKEKLQNVEFELLDENKNVVYSSLKTDSNGRIEIGNIIPGRYYIKEKNSIDGYEKYEELIAVDTELNQEIIVTVNNKKEEKPSIDITKTDKEVKQLKKLPITGM